jgi:hypothetical protein
VHVSMSFNLLDRAILTVLRFSFRLLPFSLENYSSKKNLNMHVKMITNATALNDFSMVKFKFYSLSCFLTKMVVQNETEIKLQFIEKMSKQKTF